MTTRRWFDAIRPGDVVRFKSGRLRTALDVSHRADGLVHAVRFPILHCSWTKRVHTLVYRYELGQFGECITRARIRIDKNPVAQAILEDARGRGGYRAEGASCCDVVGVFE